MYGLEPGSAAQTAALCGDDLFQILTSGIPLLQQNIQFSASIGVTCIPEHGTDTDSVIQHAYIAMYDGKKRGGINFAFFFQHDFSCAGGGHRYRVAQRYFFR
jgi:GGDEF domain-containing protein